MAVDREQHAGACPGVISIHELYTLAEARSRLRWSEAALRTARRRGLKLLTCGKRRYVAGREILCFLEQINAGQCPAGEA